MNGLPLDELVLLGRADNLRALAAVPGGRLLHGHPLDDPSHVLLREIAASGGVAAVREYLDRPAGRASMLAGVVRRLRDVDYGPLRRRGVDADAVRAAPGAAVGAARALMPGAVTGRAEGGVVFWANQRSFAVLRVRDGGHRFAAADELAASVFARRHYALSVPGHAGFLYQPASVRVVATAYDWLAEHGGRVAGLTALARTGHDPADAFRHGLPGPHQLGAWDRLAGGEGTARQRTFDVTFLLSDVLATLTQSVAFPGRPVNRLQLAYLWQVVAPPTARSARRGVIASLRAAELLDVPGLFGEIEEILTAARTAPRAVAGLLTALEDRSRLLLRRRFPAASAL